MTIEITIDGIIGSFFGVDSAEIEDQINQAGPMEPVDVTINSPGGSVFQGIKIHNLIKKHEGPTTTTVIGFAGSIASYILMAGDTRKAFDNATVMIHNAHVSFVEGGDHTFLRKLANTLESMSGLLSSGYSRIIGKSKKKTLEMMADETWFFGDGIKDEGFVNEIISTDSDETEQDAVAFNKLVFADCVEQLKEHPDTKQEIENFSKLLPQLIHKPAELPVIKNQIMEKDMTFEEFLAKFPEEAKRITAWLEASEKEKVQALSLTDILAQSETVKAEHEQVVADAKIEIENGKLTKDVAVKVGNIISSDAYGKSIKNAGIKVLTGEKDYSNFEDLVAVADEFSEKIKSEKIKANQPDPTPADGDINAETAAKEKTKAAAQALSDLINDTEGKVQ